MDNPTKKDVLFYRDLVRHHFQARKKLRVDLDNCLAVLRSEAYKPIKYPGGRDENGCLILGKTHISRRSVVIVKRNSNIKKRWVRGHCWGYANDGYPTFTSEIRKMTWLSQFLGTLPAFIGQKKH